MVIATNQSSTEISQVASLIYMESSHFHHISSSRSFSPQCKLHQESTKQQITYHSLQKYKLMITNNKQHISIVNSGLYCNESAYNNVIIYTFSIIYTVDKKLYIFKNNLNAFYHFYNCIFEYSKLLQTLVNRYE